MQCWSCPGCPGAGAGSTGTAGNAAAGSGRGDSARAGAGNAAGAGAGSAGAWKSLPSLSARKEAACACTRAQPRAPALRSWSSPEAALHKRRKT
eukprot:9704586-Alexandrium_andersonii.AAC.1